MISVSICRKLGLSSYNRGQDLRFKGGILHKVSNPLNTPASFFSIAARKNFTAISQLPGPLSGVFEIITGAKDTTLFTLTNEASEASMAGQPGVTLDSLVNTLAYYVVTPGVYFEDDFTGKTVKALNGAKLRLSGFGTGTTKVNDAVVVRSDLFATNGVLHVLDRYVVTAIRYMLVYELIGTRQAY